MSASPARKSTQATLSIGEVIDRLRSDFADVTVSKIRFLESEGLVEPSRAPSGYRKFSLDDVERLRYILGAQRDQYLPLKVIREHLDAMDRGLVIPKSAAGPRPPKNLSEVEGMPESDAFSNSNAEIAMSRAELIEASGVSSDLLKRLEDFGLVRCEGKWYNSDAFVVAKTVAQMAEFGFALAQNEISCGDIDRALSLSETKSIALKSLANMGYERLNFKQSVVIFNVKTRGVQKNSDCLGIFDFELSKDPF